MLSIFFFVSLVSVSHVAHGMSFAYSANPTVSQDLVVTWTRDPSETSQFTLVFVNDDDSSVPTQATDVSVAVDQRTGTVHFSPSAAGRSRVEQFPYRDPTGQSTGSGPDVVVAAAAPEPPSSPAQTTSSSANPSLPSTSSKAQQQTSSVETGTGTTKSSTDSGSDGSSIKSSDGSKTGGASPDSFAQTTIKSSSGSSQTNVVGSTASGSTSGQTATPVAPYSSNDTPSTSPSIPVSSSTPGNGAATSGGGLSRNKIIAIVVSAIVIVVLAGMFAILWLRRRWRQRSGVRDSFHPEMMVRRHNPALYFQPPGTLSAGSFMYQTPGVSGTATDATGMSFNVNVSNGTLGEQSLVTDTLESTSAAIHPITLSPPHFPTLRSISPRSISPTTTEPYHDPYDGMAEVIYSTAWPGQAQTHENDLRSWTFPRAANPPSDNILQNTPNNGDSSSRDVSAGHGMGTSE